MTRAPGSAGTAGSAGRDIGNREDIARLVTEFYTRVFADPVLGPVFEISGMDLDEHLPIMCDFWETVLFRSGSYRRNALAPHAALNDRVRLGPHHFERWLELWSATTISLFAGERAEFAVLQSRRIAGSIQRRLQGGSGSEFVTLRRE